MSDLNVPTVGHAEPWRPLPFTAQREASWSRDGYNRDWRLIGGGEELALADIRGCGFITRLWFAVDNGVPASHRHRLKVADPLLLRKAVLRIFWDGAEHPSVDVPVGDFFAIGHGAMRSFSSAMVEISAHPGDARGSLVSWFRMPFLSRARVVLCNESDHPLRAFWHVDFQRWERLPADLYHFHASWRCEMPCPPTPLEPDGKEGPNLTGDRNYVILDAAGEGTYFGCHLSVDNHAGGWWGEGDDMVFVDGEPFPGSLHGTARRSTSARAGGCRTCSTPCSAPRCTTTATAIGKAAGRCTAGTCPTPFRFGAASASPWNTATTTTAPTTTRPPPTGTRRGRSRSLPSPPPTTGCPAAPDPADHSRPVTRPPP